MSPFTLSLDGLVLAWLGPYQWYGVNAAITCAAIWMVFRWLYGSDQRLRTTELQGPPSASLVYGVGKRILDAGDSGALYETWAQEYGLVYAVPSTLGSKRIILCDPKAIAQFFAKETWAYVLAPFNEKMFATFFGSRALSLNYAENHRRQRRLLSPAFSIAAIRQLTTIFYDSAYKAKAAWDVLIEASGGDSTLIEVQIWMNHISLDTIGLAGFAHNFGSLEGKHSPVTKIFDTFSASPRSSTINKGVFLFGLVFPFVFRVPMARMKLAHQLNVAMEEISNLLLARTQREMELGVIGGKEDKSIIELIIKGTKGDLEFKLPNDEVISLMKQLLLAGYETTSISLTWALLELSRNPDVQTRLRSELLEHGTDPTYDQFTNGLPYLDAVVHEILRFHPPIVEFTRVAKEDDVIPLSEPIQTKSGEFVDNVTVAKGTLVSISLECMNRSTAIWGDDAKLFRPSRWLEDAYGQDGIPAKAKEIQGHRHLLTFVDGPRTCLGKNFAVAELKAVLTVLVKNFVFELRDGIDTKIELGRGVLPRPKIAGEVGCKVPLRVRPYVA